MRDSLIIRPCYIVLPGDRAFLAGAGGVAFCSVKAWENEEAGASTGQLAAGVSAEEQIMFCSYADSAKRSLGGQVVDLEVPIVGVAHQRR